MQLLERSIVRVYGYALFVLFAVTVAVTLAPSAPKHRCRCGQQAQVSADATAPRLLADAHYRAKRFDAAATTLQDAAISGVFEREIASELLVVASFYEQLGRSYALALAPETPLQDAIAALQWAAELDKMLGGAHAAELARIDP